MTPYEDADLAAVVLGRGLVTEEQLRRAARLCAGSDPRTGALGRALVESGALAATAVDGALADLARHVAPCGGCGRAFCALPGERERRVACPACGREREVQGRPGATRKLQSSEGARRRVAQSDPRREGTLPLPGSDRPRRSPFHDTGAGSTREGTLPLPGSDAARVGKSGPVVGEKEVGLAPGERVGPYEVEREISRGAMGIVLRARHVDVLERVVAIKVMLQADLDQDPDALKRFQREGEVLAKLDHPHIVRVYDAGRLSDGRPYLTMDFVEGTTLEHVARRGPMPLAEAARIVEVVARAVAFMNGRGVVHRDLKLGNILLDAKGVPRIADFGLAHVHGARTRITQDGDLLGTPLYMAPEVVRGEGGIDGRVDVYALGVMLFRLVTGSYPFFADTSVALFNMVLHATPTYPADLGPDARAVLERALARERASRYADADALAADLAALATGRPVKARPLGPLERLRDSLRRSATGAGLAAAAVLAVAIGGGSLFLARRLPGWRAEREVAGLCAALEQQRAALLTPTGDVAATRDLLARASAVLHPDAPGPSESEAGAGAEEAWRQAGVALARAAERGDEDAASALDGLGQQHARLAQVLARADLAAEVTALRGAPARVSAARLQALQARVAALDGAAAEDLTPGFERAAAWLHLSCVRAEEARAALARAAALGAPDPTLEAWTLLRLGRADDALAAADAGTASAIALELAALAPSSADALARARAALEPLAPGHGRALLDARLAWLAEPTREPPRLLDHLAAARALSDPAHLDAVPATLRGRAALLEGEVLLELGWSASAARALARARDLVGPEPIPAQALAVGAGRTLVGPDVAALALLARARAGLLDGDAALLAADEAAERATGDVLAAMLALRAEALALAGREVEARAALASARAASSALAEPDLARTAGRLAVWSEGQASGLGGAGGREAAALLAAGHAELRAAVPVDPATVPGFEPPSTATSTPETPTVATARAGLARAARAFLLAAATGDDATRGAAWAGLARTRLFAGDVDGAALAAERALAGDPTGVEALQARALVRATRGAPGAAAELLRGLDLEGQDATRPLFDRGARVLAAAVEAAWALRAAPEDVAAVLDRAEALLAEGRLPPALRERLLLAAMRASRDEARLDDLEARRARLFESVAADRLLSQRARQPDGSLLARTAEIDQAIETLLEHQPADPLWYETAHARGLELQARGYDYLTVGFELRPGLIPQRSNSTRERVVGDDVARAMLNQALQHFIADPADPARLAVPIDLDLRRASAVMLARESTFHLERDEVLGALAAAERFVARRPTSASGWVTLGYLRLDLGDFGGALMALERAAALYPPFEPRRETDVCWSHFYAALAHGALREWNAATGAVGRAAEQGMWNVERLADPRLSLDRSAAMLPALEPHVEKVRANDAATNRRKR
jgi:tRNA A-37 threonylcarbamoyl transferase component Bud32